MGKSNDSSESKNMYIFLVLIPLGLAGFIYLYIKYGIGPALLFAAIYGGISLYKYIKYNR